MAVCKTCGLEGPHAEDVECISALGRALQSLPKQIEIAVNAVGGVAHQAKVAAADANEKVDKLRKYFDKHTANGKGADHAAIE